MFVPYHESMRGTVPFILPPYEERRETGLCLSQEVLDFDLKHFAEFSSITPKYTINTLHFSEVRTNIIRRVFCQTNAKKSP